MSDMNNTRSVSQKGVQAASNSPASVNAEPVTAHSDFHYNFERVGCSEHLE